MAYWLCQPCLLGDNAYDSKAVRGELRRRRIQAVISRKGSPNIKGLGNLRLGTTYRTPRLLPLVGLPPHLLETPQEDRIVIALRAHGKGFERGGAPLLLSWLDREVVVWR
jgi:hypothetical protein